MGGSDKIFRPLYMGLNVVSNMFSCNGLRIYHNRLTKKIVIENAYEWVNMTPEHFKILLVLIRGEKPEKFTIQTDNISIEFCRLKRGFFITMYCRSYISTVTISYDTLEILRNTSVRLIELLQQYNN